MTIHVDIRPSEIESGVVLDQFDKAVAELQNNGYEIISLPQNAGLRTELGRDSFITQNGNYVVHGIVYAKGGQPLFVRTSPLVRDSDLARRAVESTTQGRYFTTENLDIYEQSLAIAKEDLGRDPVDRRVLVLPRRDNFQLSGKEHPEVFKGVFGEHGKGYLKAMDLDDRMTFIPVDHKTVNSQNGTLLTQLWFGRRDGYSWSELYGDGRHLGDGSRVRGVRKKNQVVAA